MMIKQHIVRTQYGHEERKKPIINNNTITNKP